MYLVFLNILINTGYREKLFVKCKLLKKDGLIKDVFTERGDIKVMGGYPFYKSTKALQSFKVSVLCSKFICMQNFFSPF